MRAYNGFVSFGWFGAKGDARRCPQLYCDADATTVTTVGASLSSADVGRLIVIPGGGAAGASHVATIVSVAGDVATIDTPTAAAVLSDPVQDGVIASDDTAAVACALAVAPAGSLLAVSGAYFSRLKVATTKSFSWQGSPGGGFWFANSHGIEVDRTGESGGHVAVYEDFEIVTACKPNYVGLHLIGPLDTALSLRTKVTGVTCRGISNAFIFGTAWEKGIHGVNVSNSVFDSCSGLTP